MKSLAFGVSTFSRIRTKNYIYVDKTEAIYNLYARDEYYHFLARPRRFGKSLLVSTLKELFSGNRELFRGLWIDQEGKWDWVKHPVIHFDMSLIAHITADEFRVNLVQDLQKKVRDAGMVPHKSSPEGILNDFIVELAQKQGPVVILIDEYDKPLLDKISQPEELVKMRERLKSFYDSFKGLDEYIRALFITGVSTFSITSIFSGLNMVTDISLLSEAAALVGYTKQEVIDNFGEHIGLVAHELQSGAAEIVDRMEEWYNGYRFSQIPISVFNPCSIMFFLKTKNEWNFWFVTGTPSFLVPLIQKDYAAVANLDAIKVSPEDLSAFDVSYAPIESVLFQAGYLTIASYDSVAKKFTLKIPNCEVTRSFNIFIIAALTCTTYVQVGRRAGDLVRALQNDDLEGFFEVLQVLFAHIPYKIHIKEEAYYHSLFYFLSVLLEFDLGAELLTDKGRIDVVLQTQTHIYLMELKINSTPAAALKQIHDKKYYERFMGDPRVIILVGLNFTTKHSSLTIEWEKEEMPAVGASRAGSLLLKG